MHPTIEYFMSKGLKVDVNPDIPSMFSEEARDKNIQLIESIQRRVQSQQEERTAIFLPINGSAKKSAARTLFPELPASTMAANMDHGSIL